MEGFKNGEKKLLRSNLRLLTKEFAALLPKINNKKQNGDAMCSLHQKVETLIAKYWTILQQQGVDIKFLIYRDWLGVYITRKFLAGHAAHQFEAHLEMIAAWL